MWTRGGKKQLNKICQKAKNKAENRTKRQKISNNSVYPKKKKNNKIEN